MLLSEDMALSKGTVRRLKEVLREATALVIVDRQPVGTAFFIDDELLLTCAHVIPGQVVEIWPYKRERRPDQGFVKVCVTVRDRQGRA